MEKIAFNKIMNGTQKLESTKQNWLGSHRPQLNQKQEGINFWSRKQTSEPRTRSWKTEKPGKTKNLPPKFNVVWRPIWKTMEQFLNSSRTSKQQLAQVYAEWNSSTTGVLWRKGEAHVHLDCRWLVLAEKTIKILSLKQCMPN